MSPTVRALALGLTLTLAFFGLLLGRETGSRVTDGRVQSIGHFASQEELVVVQLNHRIDGRIRALIDRPFTKLLLQALPGKSGSIDDVVPGPAQNGPTPTTQTTALLPQPKVTNKTSFDVESFREGEVANEPTKGPLQYPDRSQSWNYLWASPRLRTADLLPYNVSIPYFQYVDDANAIKDKMSAHGTEGSGATKEYPTYSEYPYDRFPNITGDWSPLSRPTWEPTPVRASSSSSSSSSSSHPSCPGGNVNACIGLCPSDPADAFKACTASCGTRCH